MSVFVLSFSIILAFVGVGLVFPNTVGAFWPFSTAKADTTPSPVLHDPSLDLLAAPLSSEVDDTFIPAPVPVDGVAMVPGSDLGTSTPAGDTSTADTVTAPTSGAISEYTVKAGDSLSQIAQNFGVTVNTILWANNITDPGTIKEGTKLVILPVSGIQHTVRSGETLSSIAEKYGGDAKDIAQFNGISANSPLKSGSDIIIPGGVVTSSQSSGSKGSSGKGSKSESGASSSSKGENTSSSGSSTSHNSSAMNYSDETGNPYRGGGGSAHHGFFTNPLPGALLTQGLHGWDAVDLGAHTGTPILAAASGSVILSRMGGWNGGYGNYVILDNGSGITTLYAHMSQTKAEVGENVSAGQVIGYVGTSGDATGAHLHFEVRGAQNPFSYCTEMTVCANPN